MQWNISEPNENERRAGKWSGVMRPGIAHQTAPTTITSPKMPSNKTSHVLRRPRGGIRRRGGEGGRYTKIWFART